MPYFYVLCFTDDYIFSSQSGGGYFPQPRQGESLKSFLSSQDFDTCAELDRVRIVYIYIWLGRLICLLLYSCQGLFFFCITTEILQTKGWLWDYLWSCQPSHWLLISWDATPTLKQSLLYTPRSKFSREFNLATYESLNFKICRNFRFKL